MPPEASAPLGYWILPGGAPAGFAERVADELSRCALVRLDAEAPDFVLDLAGGADTEGIAARSAWGIWRFEVARRPIAHLREACRVALARDEPGLPARLLAIDGRDDGHSTVLREGLLPVDPFSSSRTLREAMEELSRWPIDACRGLVATGRLQGPGKGEEPPVVGPADARDASAPGVTVRLATAAASRACRVLLRHDHWNFGVLNVALEEVSPADLAEGVCWAPDPPRHVFRADPFGAVVDGRAWIVYEELDYRSGRGRIAAARWGEGGRLFDRRTVFASDHHLSYPYLIREEGDIYCVPESSETRKVELYRATNFPSEWEKSADLIAGRAMLDSTLFRHGERWWLLATDRDRGPRHVLTAWYAPSLGGPWKAHARNPVKVDVQAGRPAGTPFRRNGALYRPAQDCSRRYGGAVVINRVDVLTPTRFEEVAVARFDPPPDGPYPEGVHTLSRLGPDRTLVDGNRSRFSRHELTRRLRGFAGY